MALGSFQYKDIVASLQDFLLEKEADSPPSYITVLLETLYVEIWS